MILYKKISNKEFDFAFHIGVTKSATTSLFNQIKKDNICSLFKKGKESNFFIKDKSILGSNKKYSYKTLRDMGFADYLNMYDKSNNLRMEICTTYFHFAQDFLNSVFFLFKKPHDISKS